MKKKPVKINFIDLYDDESYDTDDDYFLTLIMTISAIIFLPFFIIKLILKALIKVVLK